MPTPSIRRQLDALLALAVLPACVLAALALWFGDDARPATPLPSLLMSPAGLALVLLLAGCWGGALWLARRLAASIARTEDALAERPLRCAQAAAGHGPACSAVVHLKALEHQASHDELTGLANRRLFDATLRRRLEDGGRDGTPVALLYVDIDGFKGINDEHGHAVGDQLLCLFAARLKAGLRDTDEVARLGGDEFAVILGQASTTEAAAIADGLVERLSRPYRVGDRMLKVSASIGLAAGSPAGHAGPSLLAAADAAMYQAKQAGKGRRVISGFGSL